MKLRLDGQVLFDQIRLSVDLGLGGYITFELPKF